MKTNGCKPFDDVADSMAAAASRLGVPLEAVKLAKRNGSSAFRGSRVQLSKLKDDLGLSTKQPRVADVLLKIAHDVADRVSDGLARYPEKWFRTDCDKLCDAIHNGFGAALCVVEPDSADHFLSESRAMFESVFQKPARKRSLWRVHQPKIAAKKVEATLSETVSMNLKGSGNRYLAFAPSAVANIH
jgi:hypothetical protein